MQNELTLSDGVLRDGRGAVLGNVPDSVTAVEDPAGVGVFLRVAAEKPAPRLVLPLGDLAGVRRWTCCHRYEPFWMTARAGVKGGEVPVETQYLLAEREDGSCLLIVPLLDGAFRCSLEGAGEDGLALVVESGDDATVGKEFVGLFVAAGEDPFALMEAAAPAVMARMKTGRLRRDKPEPEFLDYFGWCTWDSFYREVSAEKVQGGLQSFADGGIHPKLLILDDGWQPAVKTTTREERLTGFAANEKFPGDLAPLVNMAKGQFGVSTVLVWHAVGGYWGGVDGDALPGYGVRSVSRRYSPGIHSYYPDGIPWFGTACGVVAPEHVYRFYQDYHRHLRGQGVDGVKVDNQASLEGLGQGGGGRVALMRAYHEALEGSVQVHFNGNLINCMSCSNEMLYGALNSTLTRTSTDFWPKKPESHGLHLYVNAQVSAWFGEFVLPDWDMFQSGHEMGAYHAAGRAVGGCPVYVSDKPDAHDFTLLRKLVTPDGMTLRAEYPGRPTRDCLFHDPTKEDVLLKIWNANAETLVVGAFHARYGEGVGAIAGQVSPADVPDSSLSAERYAVYAHNAGELRALDHDEAWPLTLDPLTCEVFTLAPIRDGFAAVGIVDYLNAGGAIADVSRDRNGTWSVAVRAGGTFLAWCDRAPGRVEVIGDPAAFTYDAATGRLEVPVPTDTTFAYIEVTS